MSSTEASSGSTLEWFAKNPVIGFLGTLASIIGLLLAVVIYFATEKHREIVYQISRSPTTVVQSGKSSDLRVYFRGSELTGDVSSLQICVWNAGGESVRRENILSKAVSVNLGPVATILTARLAKTTRSLTGFTCQSPSLRSVSCSWDILEKNDGGLLDIIYLGKAGIESVNGEIEGQLPLKEISDLEHGRRTSGPRLVPFLLASLLGLAGGFYPALRNRDKVGPWERLTAISFLTIFGLFMVGCCVAVLFPHFFFPFSPFPL